MNYEQEAEALLAKLLGEDHLHQKDTVYGVLEKAYDEGYSDGLGESGTYNDGYEDGYTEGYDEGAAIGEESNDED